MTFRSGTILAKRSSEIIFFSIIPYSSHTENTGSWGITFYKCNYEAGFRYLFVKKYCGMLFYVDMKNSMMYEPVYT